MKEKIAQFIGRDAGAVEPMRVIKHWTFPCFLSSQSAQRQPAAVEELGDMFQHRKNVQRGLLSSHGKARLLVTFLDNHDMHARFYFSDPGEPRRFDDKELTMGIACLYCLTGMVPYLPAPNRLCTALAVLQPAVPRIALGRAWKRL